MPEPTTVSALPVLYPAIAEAAHRAGANAVALVDVGSPTGLNLHADRVGITYSNGQSLGDPTSAVQVSSLMRGRPVPERAIPTVVARVGVARVGTGPDLDEAETALASTAPPLLLRGDAVEMLPGAFAQVPADALPVVITTWALSRFPLERRLRFLQCLDAAATKRAVAWVSVEGVGVAPGIPTFGDRHASGHSIVGLAVLGHSSLQAEAIGRCWSRGRFLAWLADS
jgi:hypothetical protein